MNQKAFKKIKVKDLGKNLYLLEHGMFINKEEIKSIESNETMSWYYHDVYKKINNIMVSYNKKTERWEYFLPDNKLYNLTKLKGLYKSRDFKLKRFAFFRYGEVERLLKKEVKSAGMSGFLP